MSPAPDAEATTAFAVQRPTNGTHAEDSAEDATRAIPIAKARVGDTEAATEKLNSRAEAGKGAGDDDKAPQRRGSGGGVSAQDLLRREGRL